VPAAPVLPDVESCLVNKTIIPQTQVAGYLATLSQEIKQFLKRLLLNNIEISETGLEGLNQADLVTTHMIISQSVLTRRLDVIRERPYSSAARQRQRQAI